MLNPSACQCTHPPAPLSATATRGGGLRETVNLKKGRKPAPSLRSREGDGGEYMNPISCFQQSGNIFAKNLIPFLQTENKITTFVK
jgi:hypothetical protein